MFTFLALLPARSSETKKHKKQLCSVPLFNKMPTLSTDNFQNFSFLTLPRGKL